MFVNWLTIPNAFTYVRILMTPWILVKLAHGEWLVGGWLFGGAAFTDLVDGGLARRFGWQSRAGLYIDPVADKFLITSVYLGLAIGHAVPIWLVILIFGRDLWILGLSAIAFRFTKFRDLNPSIWGKLSTFFQVLTAVFVMAAKAYGYPVFATVAAILMWVVAILAVMSGAGYTWRGIAYLRRR